MVSVRTASVVRQVRRGAGRYMSPNAVEPIAEMPDDPEKSGCDM